MTSVSSRWQRLRAVFDEVVELPHAAQPARLDQLTAGDPELRAEIESLLIAERSAGDRFEQAPTLFADLPAPGPTAGTRIGAYRVTREIGRGGMGTVYEAFRDDAEFTKRVAIKMVASGRDTELILRRFRYERRILARLEHKNIAALLDGGLTEDGRPYFAMEFVEGERIDRYCQRKGLTVRERLQLMRQVCTAVQYAHQNLVVHRDLKPSNIMVGPDGTIKLLDFGIAKLIDPGESDAGLTESGVVPLTTAYASPEQLRGDPVSTATDIYSLGVVLYHLVAGRPPFSFENLPLLEVRQRILEETPLPPSIPGAEEAVPGKLPKSLAHELDHIVLMALRKEPGRRYASAEQLSGDLLGLLSGLPIHAQPDSLGYRARKFIARNRAAVAALIVIFLTLVGGLGISLWQAATVRREQAKAEAVSEFLQSLLEASSPDVSVTDKQARQRTVTDVLDAAALRLETEDLSAQPDVKATLQRIIGSSYLSQGQYELAEKNLRAAWTAQIARHGEDAVETLSTLVSLAQLFFRKADYPRAEEIYRRRLAILRREVSTGRLGPTVLSIALGDFALLLRARGHSEEAELLLREALALTPKLPAEDHDRESVLESFMTLALLDRGKFAEAETSARRLVAQARQEAHPESPALCGALTILGSVLMERGQLEEAGRWLREGETLYRRLFDSNFVATYDNVRLQAQVLYEQGRLPEAESRIEQTLLKYRRFLQPQYISYATAVTVKGLILNRGGRRAEAERELREALRLRTDNLPASHFMTALTQGALGEVLVAQRRFAEAEPLLTESYTALLRSQAERNPRTELARRRLVDLYTAWDRPDKLALLR